MPDNQQIADQAGWETAQNYFREVDQTVTPAASPIVIRKSDVEIRTLAEWRLYASPKGGDAQWRDYRSAKELARAWCPDGIGPTIPPETRALLANHSEFSSFEINEVFPEHRVRFDDFPGEPPNADLMAVGTANGESFVMGVIGRGDEPFGAFVSDELTAAARRVAREDSAPSFARITALSDALLPARTGGEPHLGELRYHLLTAVAGTLAYASERSAKRAVLMVHEFRTHNTNDALLADNQRDLERFVERVSNGRTRNLPMNHLLGPYEVPGSAHIRNDVQLFVGKVRRELLALEY